ncbi:MAG: NAD(P)H-dependent oxidoreductase subunit E [Candidatus Brocadiae bacterium]|nr:NAD(P)H-dependent oxidoreductase subunit E [Candidatus Brocadiia bacterium]
MTQRANGPDSRDIRPQQGVDTKDIREIVARRGDERGGLIAVLQDIQARYGYLPQEGLKEVAEGTGRSLVDVYGVATFYRSFSLTPRGKHLICVCLGTACHVRGAPRILEQFQRELGVGVGGTTPDGEFTLETVNCLGACALGPVVVVDGKYFSNVAMPGVKGILREARSGSTRLKEPAAQASAR